MKQVILRNIVLVLAVIVMVVLTILGTITAHGETILQKRLTQHVLKPSPTITPTNPNISKPGQSATPAATLSATSDFTNRDARIAFVANRNGSLNIYTMDPDGKNILQLTNTTEYKLFPTWSPDGKLMAYLVGIAAGLPPKLMVMNANGSNAHQIKIGKAIAISAPTWSPDSSQLAYISVRSRTSENGLYIVDVAANREHQLETGIPIDFSYTPPADNIALTDAFAPSWSPNGKTILLYGGLGTAEKTTLLVTLKGKAVAPLLTNSKLIATDASWSPDGSMVLFVGLEPMGKYTRVSIEILDTTGNSLSELPPDEKVVPQFPVWSPDGKQIVFAGIRFSDQVARIYVMNADGSNEHQLTEDTFSRGDGWPSWDMSLKNS